MKLDGIFWDYDGTIVDTNEKNYSVAKEIYLKVNSGVNEVNLPKVLQSSAEYLMAILKTSGWKDLCINFLKLNEHQIDETVEVWSKYYKENKIKVDLFEGIDKVISYFSGYPNAICSQNCQTAIRKSLIEKNISDYFTSIVGFNDVSLSEQKPHPLVFIKCLENLQLSDVNLLVYIGDHPHDVKFAKNAAKALSNIYKKNITVLSIAACYGHPQQLQWPIMPDFYAYSVEELFSIIKKISQITQSKDLEHLLSVKEYV